VASTIRPSRDHGFLWCCCWWNARTYRISNTAFHNPIFTALGGTWGENLGFYGKILYSDIADRRKRDEKITFMGCLKVLRNAIFEFGVAELADSFAIRPYAMYFFPQLTGNVVLGLILGKFSADIIFYFPTIIFYEVRKKLFKD
jgi:hypothetical protein